MWDITLMKSTQDLTKIDPAWEFGVLISYHWSNVPSRDMLFDIFLFFKIFICEMAKRGRGITSLEHCKNKIFVT